jgi:PleD family two-component response regulator
VSGTILIVDDQPENLRLLSTILADHHHTIRAVRDGAMALKSISATPPDLILLDITMPGMSGYEVCHHLKAQPETRDIPVIFISFLDETLNKVAAFEAGGVDYIMRPFQAEEVLARVQTHLTMRRLHQQLQAQNIRLQEDLAARTRIEHERQHSLALMQAIINQAQAVEQTIVHVVDVTEPVQLQARIIENERFAAHREPHP